jgi:DNA-binding Lrp family transcriptional regulator
MWKFLNSEMLVILGLVEDASRTDAEIGDVYGLNKGTVASIRRRLTDAGALFYVNVPAFNKLGCEMLGFHMGSTDPAISSDIKTSNYTGFCEQAPQIFAGMIGGNSVTMYTALRSGTEFEEFCQLHNKFFTGQKRPSKARLESIVFPYRVTKGSFCTNFAPLVHRFFNLDVPPPKSRLPVSGNVETPDLSPTEKETLIAVVEHPESSDREIADIVRLSRQAVTRIRNKLLDTGIVTPVCIPRLYRWGYEIYALAHAKFSMDIPWEKRMRSQPRDVVELSFYTLSKADEGVGNYMIPRFQEYTENLESVLAWYHRAKIFDEKPNVHVFAMERCTELRNFEFGPALRHILSGA